jgi:hypothetical protein
MKKKNKHIYTYIDYLIEQDMSMVGAPAAPLPKKIIYPFLFMTGQDDAGNNRRKYPDGSVIIEYPCYSIDLDTLKEWIKTNIVDAKLNSSELTIRHQNLEDIVKGDRTHIAPDDLPFIEKLKNAVSSNLVGKPAPDVSVIFSNNVPTTEDVNVTFIKHKK